MPRLVPLQISLLLGSLALSHTAHALNWNITDLGSLNGGETHVTAINNSGDVVGWSRIAPGQQHAFLYRGGQMIDIGPQDTFYSTAEAINNAGLVAGSKYQNAMESTFIYGPNGISSPGSFGWRTALYERATHINNNGQIAGYAHYTADDSERAFVSSGNGLHDLGTLGGKQSYLAGLNDAGQGAGYSSVASGALHAVASDGHSLTDLGTLGGNNSWANAINQQGVIVGVSNTIDSSVQAFISHGSGMSDMRTLMPGNEHSLNTWAFDINDKGQIVGVSDALGGYIFDMNSRKVTQLDLLHGSAVQPVSINNQGQVFGRLYTANNELHPFFYSNGEMMDLNTVLPGVVWDNRLALPLNDAGQIAASAMVNGEVHAFLLTPVPEPETWAMLLAGLGVVGYATRQRRQIKA